MIGGNQRCVRTSGAANVLVRGHTGYVDTNEYLSDLLGTRQLFDAQLSNLWRSDDNNR